MKFTLEIEIDSSVCMRTNVDIESALQLVARSFHRDGKPSLSTGEVYAENGNIVGSWEVKDETSNPLDALLSTVNRLFPSGWSPEIESLIATMQAEQGLLVRITRPEWQPLANILTPQQCALHMFMGTAQPAADPVIFQYKHTNTRRYLHVDAAGKTYRYDGGKYTEMPRAQAIEYSRS